MKLDFSGQIVAVTGASSGFGTAIATQFSLLGATVYATDVSEAALRPLAENQIRTAAVDLLDRRAAADWITSVARSAGKVDVLVNNAGGVMGHAQKPIESVTDAEWDNIMDINLSSAFALARAVTPAMKAQKSGAIVTIASGAALHASLTGVQAYCAAKHATLGLTRQLAHELGPHGVRVNAIAPGFVRTNAATEAQWDAMGTQNQAALMRSIALGRLGTPQDIANVTVFLASSLASFVNGQIIAVDGGK
jgi:3-oxoacyl-[acyl-carrier protein] reductase